jgi:hypothetical protein
MIEINFELQHPGWFNRFRVIGSRHGATPVPNKHWEVELTKTDSLIKMSLSWRRRQDHAGIGVELALVGWCVSVHLYDNRHWDYAAQNWEKLK